MNNQSAWLRVGQKKLIDCLVKTLHIKEKKPIQKVVKVMFAHLVIFEWHCTIFEHVPLPQHTWVCRLRTLISVRLHLLILNYFYILGFLYLSISKSQIMNICFPKQNKKANISQIRFKFCDKILQRYFKVTVPKFKTWV